MWELIIWFFILAVFGGAIGSMAYIKGKSLWLWWIIGFFVFPIAFLLILFLPSNQRVIRARRIKNGMKACPHCAELILEDAKVCKHCRRELVEVA